MEILTFLVAMIVVVVLIASGVVVNMRLYPSSTEPVAALHRVSAVSARRKSVRYSRLYVSDKEMGNYARKSVAVLLGTILALFVLIAMVLSAIH
jgi:hypothetical protein